MHSRRSPIAAILLSAALIASSLAAQAAAPTDDDYADAQPIDLSTLPVTVTGSNVDATLERGERAPCISTANLASTVWYTITPSYDQRLEIETFDSDFDTVLAVYVGDTLDTAGVLACEDDTEGFQAGVSLLTRAGTTYHIQVGGWAAPNAEEPPRGDIDLTLHALPNPEVRSYVATTAGTTWLCDDAYGLSNPGLGGICDLWVAGARTLDLDIQDAVSSLSPMVAIQFWHLDGSFIETVHACGDTDGIPVPLGAETVDIATTSMASLAIATANGETFPTCALTQPPATVGELALTMNL